MVTALGICIVIIALGAFYLFSWASSLKHSARKVPKLRQETSLAAINRRFDFFMCFWAAIIAIPLMNHLSNATLAIYLAPLLLYTPFVITFIQRGEANSINRYFTDIGTYRGYAAYERIQGSISGVATIYCLMLGIIVMNGAR